MKSRRIRMGPVPNDANVPMVARDGLRILRSQHAPLVDIEFGKEHVIDVVRVRSLRERSGWLPLARLPASFAAWRT